MKRFAVMLVLVVATCSLAFADDASQVSEANSMASVAAGDVATERVAGDDQWVTHYVVRHYYANGRWDDDGPFDLSQANYVLHAYRRAGILAYIYAY